MDQIEDSETDTHKYSQLIFDKGANVIQWSYNGLIQQMMLEQMKVHMQKILLKQTLHLTQIQSGSQT